MTWKVSGNAEPKGTRVSGLGFRVSVEGLGFSKFRVSGLGFSKFRV